MIISVVTIFPEFFDSSLVGITKRAIDNQTLMVECHDIRRHGAGKHRQVDDSPFGGGPGMVMTPEPLVLTLEPLMASHKVFLTPSGERLTQEHLDRWSKLHQLTLVCGRYEGIDQRVIDAYADDEISIGDFVIAGGEAAALVVIEGVSRLLPGAVGNPSSTESESFRHGLLEEPHYTRPATFMGVQVPEILLSGDHASISAWRSQQRLERTRQRRPDLLDDAESTSG